MQYSGENKIKTKIPTRIEYKSLADIAYRIIRDKILICELKPGSKIVEEKLAQEMGISRTPLRKALTKLEKEEFIVVVPRKGTYVKKLSPKEIKEIYELRRLLEGFAAEQAARFINVDQLKKMRQSCRKHSAAAKKGDLLSCLIYNMEFHRILVEASKNAKLLKVLNGFHLQLQAMRLSNAEQSPEIMGTQEEVVNEHLSIVEALSKGDGKLAKRLVEEHIISKRTRKIFSDLQFQ